MHCIVRRHTEGICTRRLWAIFCIQASYWEHLKLCFPCKVIWDKSTYKPFGYAAGHILLPEVLSKKREIWNFFNPGGWGHFVKLYGPIETAKFGKIGTKFPMWGRGRSPTCSKAPTPVYRLVGRWETLALVGVSGPSWSACRPWDVIYF